ncbi:MAG TPA: signal peptidase I [Acidobacteriaceae bacterium]|nr:signal peptidase I [Terriglobia bacterium]HVC89659.1 signal peptidase I [Acidobacteriaceae bacterium]
MIGDPGPPVGASTSPEGERVEMDASSAAATDPTLPGAAGHPPVRTPHHHEALILMQTTLTFLVSALFVLTFIAQPYRIPSGSMENTLLIGDFLLVNKVVFATPGPWKPLLAYEPVRHDDIVVFHYPINPSMYLVKRVIGVPGDELHLHHGLVYVDGHYQNEPYAIYVPSYANAFRDEFPTSIYTDPGVSSRWWMQMQQSVHDGQLLIPADEYFVLGDNRNDSLDSRYWGLVPHQGIVGEPLLVYFSVVTASRSEITGLTSDRLAHEHGWWNSLAGAVRWSRIFHVIR